MIFPRCILAIVLLVAPFTACSSAMVVVKDGRPMATIVLPAAPTEQETAAAEDLRAYLEKMSGASLPIISEPTPPEDNAILIGRTKFALNNLGERLTRENLGYEGYTIKAVGSRLVLVGMSVDPYRVPRPKRHSGDGTRHAVFDLLERMGCRFFAFHQDGEHVPNRKTISVDNLDVTSKPDFEFRRIYFSFLKQMPKEAVARWDAWSLGNRLGGPFMSMAHAYSRYSHSPIPRDEKESLFEHHPEYFALVRDDDGVLRRMIDKQLCLSNRDVLRRAIDAADTYFRQKRGTRVMPAYSLSPSDLKEGWCECDECKAWDDPDKAVGLATRVLRFNNLVAEALADEFPDRRFPYYAEYSNMPGPPVRDDGTVVLKAHRAVLPVYVNIYCLVHDIADPSCPLNAEHRRRIAKWRQAADGLYIYEWYMWTSINPLPVNDVIGPRIRYYRDQGVKGYYAEVLGHSPDNTLSMYLAAKMLWDADQDPDALRDEFFRLYFQEAAEPMRRYYRILNEGALQSKSHGVRFLGIRPNTRMNVDPPINVERAEHLKQALETAIAMASQPVVQRRLDRERMALKLYEMEAKILALYDQCIAERTPQRVEALRVVFEQYSAHYPKVSGIVRYCSKHRGSMNRVKKLIEKR